MKRAIGLPNRILVAGVAYGATCAASILATYAAWRVFETNNGFSVSMAICLTLWLALAYFPARYVYGAVTYKVFADGKHCEGCGYDLTGNITGVCPECSTPTLLSQVVASTEPFGRLSRARLTSWRIGVLAVVVFVCALFLGYWWAMPAAIPLPAEFRPAQPPIAFARLAEEWERADDEGLSYYVISNNKVVARLTYDRDDKGSLVGVGVANAAEKVWLDVDVSQGTFARTIFASQVSGESGGSDITLQDVDADGVPDLKRDWTTGAVFRRCEPLKWELLATSTGPAIAPVSEAPAEESTQTAAE